MQHLLANVPKDTQNKFEIVEKTNVTPPLSSSNAVYDSIEGYRIEIKKDGKSPSTMVLRKKKEEEIKKEKEEKEKKKKEEEQLVNESLEDDPDALFETMMMLKEMNMDKEDQIVTEPTETKSVETKPVETKTIETKTIETKPVETKTIETKPIETKSIETNPVETKPIETKPTKKKTAKSKVVETKSTSAGESSSDKAAEDTNVIQVTQKAAKKAIKKKSAVPELSLFGTIWTILDHLTTKATRTYLNELQNNHRRVDVSVLVANELMDDSNYLRGQILSERILDT